MRTRQHVKPPASSDFVPMVQSRAMESRPFADTVAAQPTPNIQAKLDRASKPSVDMGAIDIFPPVQAKLTIGAVGDPYEQEADNVAAQVVDQINSPQVQAADEENIQRSAPEEELKMKPVDSVQREEMKEDELKMKPVDSIQREEMKEDELKMKPVDSIQREAPEEELKMKPVDSIQREAPEEELKMKPVDSIQREAPEEELKMKPVDSIQREAPEEELNMKPMLQRQGDGTQPASDGLESAIQSQRGGGQPLGKGVKGAMESAFGADFSGVRVHTDTQSDQLNQSIQARAFTTGSDVFFRQGAYNPDSRGGQELLAHELTHVVQQGAAQRKAADK